MLELRDMKTDELVAMRDSLSAQREAIRATLQAINSVLGGREAEEAAMKKLASMSPAEIQALMKLTKSLTPNAVAPAMVQQLQG